MDFGHWLHGKDGCALDVAFSKVVFLLIASALWFLMCVFMVLEVGKDFWHWLHWNGICPVWYNWWIFRVFGALNDLSHWLQVKGFFPLWANWWYLSDFKLFNSFPHWGQEKRISSPVWNNLGLFKWCGCLKDLSQPSHLKGFTFVWILWCAFKFPDCLKDCSHWLQAKGFFSLWLNDLRTRNSNGKDKELQCKDKELQC